MKPLRIGRHAGLYGLFSLYIVFKGIGINTVDSCGKAAFVGAGKKMGTHDGGNCNFEECAKFIMISCRGQFLPMIHRFVREQTCHGQNTQNAYRFVRELTYHGQYTQNAYRFVRELTCHGQYTQNAYRFVRELTYHGQYFLVAHRLVRELTYHGQYFLVSN
ncbi:hypothetical protein QMK38_05995 [Lysinibacillus fusiformis]|nr:hypothetical protein [Lysinibacillus fusiformis]